MVVAQSLANRSQLLRLKRLIIRTFREFDRRFRWFGSPLLVENRSYNDLRRFHRV